MNTIVFATKNKGKLREIKEIMKGCSVISIDEAGIEEEIEENGTTFEENAIIKAKAIFELLGDDLKGSVVLADDSGLEIDWLNGAPGVYSARFLGENTGYKEKNDHILELLKDAPEEKRGARFVCTIAAVVPNEKNYAILTVSDKVEGVIHNCAQGENGFGYDPIFFVTECGKTMAELPAETKNLISHRGGALKKIREKLEQL